MSDTTPPPADPSDRTPAPPPDADDATLLAGIMRMVLEPGAPWAALIELDDPIEAAQELRKQLDKYQNLSNPTMRILMSQVRSIADHFEALAETRAALARCVGALEFYANADHWERDPYGINELFDPNDPNDPNDLNPGYARARAALADAARVGGKVEGRT